MDPHSELRGPVAPMCITCSQACERKNGRWSPGLFRERKSKAMNLPLPVSLRQQTNVRTTKPGTARRVMIGPGMALCPHFLKCMPSKEAVTVLTTAGGLWIMAQARRELNQTNPMSRWTSIAMMRNLTTTRFTPGSMKQRDRE
uniref:Uncharacterized protein n=1 Tax=Fusarium oxysporum (strain Fo5176) TaxID=660025 RepID=A0A0D2XW43_FUSOF